MKISFREKRLFIVAINITSELLINYCKDQATAYHKIQVLLSTWIPTLFNYWTKTKDTKMIGFR